MRRRTESRLTQDFRRQFEALPAEVQERARRAYALWQEDPQHPGLHFKRVSEHQPIWSARVGLRHRALALREQNIVWWFWIGTHAEYDQLLKRL